MVLSKPIRRKFRSMLVTLILLSSTFISLSIIFVPHTGKASPWWDTRWNFRKLITLNHTQVNTTLENFPVLIDIVDNDLRVYADFDGSDIDIDPNQVVTLEVSRGP